jgi:hypothetical protein
MDINKIIPYENNARHNEKAVPVVADSIREFGFKGAIVLRSRENPTIVNGHTRVAACKLLGWTDFPDEYITFAEDLTDEQVKALRLADNRTGEIATWNTALLKNEMRGIGNLDMSRFAFDFKSKKRSYGAERLRTDDSYNLQLIDSRDCGGRYGMPLIEKTEALPNRLLAFNYAKSASDGDCWLHFFIDDYQFERLWNAPAQYLDLIKRFNGVLSPDFSCYMNMPFPMQQWNEYRRRALMRYWQLNGVEVIPTLSWSTPKSYGFSFEGIKRGSTVAVSTVGVVENDAAADVWRSGMSAALKRIKPEKIVLYGRKIDFDFENTEVIEFSANTSFVR